MSWSEVLALLFGTATLSAMVRLAVPLIYTGIGGVFAATVGVFNIGLESFMLFSAFFATLGSYLYASAVMGVLFGVAASCVAAAVFALFVLVLRSDEIIVGIAFNAGSVGLTTLFMIYFLDSRGSFADPRVTSFQPIEIPVLKDIPFVGDLFSGYNILAYLCFAMAAAAYFVVYRTSFGLRLRGVGSNSVGAQAAGINVMKYRWIALLISGVCAGIAGASLPLSGLSVFTENMTAGKGFLALAAIIVANGNPLRIVYLSLIFAYVEALSVGMQRFGISSYLVLMMPYVATIFVLVVITVRKQRRAAIQATQV
ncbi:MAG: ABC transporter permease [Mesorhizobium sp.]